MYQFFIQPDQIAGENIRITGTDVNHIKNVLRMRIGEPLSVIAAGEDREYSCVIAGYEEDAVLCSLKEVKEGSVELSNQIYLFQGLPKSDKMELIIQKAVELGVYQMIPVQTRRVIVKLDAKKEASRIARWNAIAEAAAKQSKRRIIPEVKPVMTFQEAVAFCADFEKKLIPYEHADMEAMNRTRQELGRIKRGQRVAVFIGPEGGFDEQEIQFAGEAGIVPITLGRRILRTETAGLTILAWLVYVLEEMS